MGAAPGPDCETTFLDVYAKYSTDMKAIHSLEVVLEIGFTLLRVENQYLVCYLRHFGFPIEQHSHFICPFIDSRDVGTSKLRKARYKQIHRADLLQICGILCSISY